MTNNSLKTSLGKSLSMAVCMFFTSCSPQFSGANSLNGESPGTPESLGDVEFVEIGTPDGQTKVVPVFPSQDDFNTAVDSVETTATYLFQNIRQRCAELVDPSIDLGDGLIGVPQADRLDIECVSGFYVNQQAQEGQGAVSLWLTGSYGPMFVPLTRELSDRMGTQIHFVASRLDALITQTPTDGHVGVVFSFLRDLIEDVTDIEFTMTVTSEDGQTVSDSANVSVGDTTVPGGGDTTDAPDELFCSAFSCGQGTLVEDARNIICPNSGCVEALCCE